MVLQRVLLIGATGNLGSLVLKYLLSSPSNFSVTVLTRESSTATNDAQLPSSVTVAKIADDYPSPELVKAFSGIDVVISAISMEGMHLQYKFIDAAVEAKVKRYIPTEFGLDELPDWLVELRPMFKTKHDVRDYLVAKEAEGLEWTCIVCNVFFEMNIKSPVFGCNWDEKKFTLIDDGKVKWVATTVDTVALAIVRAIEKEKETRNRLLLVQDFRISQKEILDKVQEKCGNTWTVEEVKYDDWLEEAKETVRKGDNSVIWKLTFATVLLGSKWEERSEFANNLLELPTKAFDKEIESVLSGIS